MLPRVSSRVSGFPVASPCLWGKLQNLSFSKVSKQVVMSFCVAGAALCDISNLFDNVSKVVLCGRRNTFAIVFNKMSCSLRVYTGATFWRLSVVILRGRRSLHFTLHTLHSAPHSTVYTPHSTSTLCTPHFTLHTVHSILYTLHFTLHTPHFTLYTPHFTLYTPHSTLYTPHSTLYTPHPHFTL